MADARHEPRATDSSSPEAQADDFEFRIVPTGGGPASAGAGADMCVADELFSGGKLLPLRPSSAAAADVPGAVLLPRCESVAGLGSRYDCRSASSSGSSSGCVSRSHSSKSASSEHGAAPPARRSLSSSLFYAHPSPSPQLRSSTRPRRSTGSAPPPARWGVLRLGVVGAPDVYPPRPSDSSKITAASRGGSGRSARFERAANAVERSFRKHGAGLGFGCRCSPDVVVEPVGLPDQAARKSGADDAGVKSGRSARRSRILEWLEELSIGKGKK
ncbi:hypothetical protein ACQ4PT_042665 [Festuca glaucescens]